MPNQSRVVSPGPDGKTVRTSAGEVLQPPADWVLLPPGDATLTRRVKAAGPTWTVQEKRGRKLFSLGVWASAELIGTIKEALATERATASYGKRRAADAARRESKQQQYVESFRAAVLEFLAFAPRHAELGEQLADAIAAHATPIGSGTVARTERIPIEKRAESAVIAWLRHQTTAYDQMIVPRIKGKRREVRRMLAEESRRLLKAYRADQPSMMDRCPIRAALAQRHNRPHPG
jgi:hypothetical protein